LNFTSFARDHLFGREIDVVSRLAAQPYSNAISKSMSSAQIVK
jgi:hypothetical protein